MRRYHPFIDTRETSTYHRFNTMKRRRIRFPMFVAYRVFPYVRYV